MVQGPVPGRRERQVAAEEILRAIPESQAAAPRTPAPPPAAAAPDYEFDEAAAVAAPAPAPAPAPRLASPAAFLPDVPSWPTGDAAAPAAPPPGVAAAAPPPPPAGGPKKPASKPRGRVPAAPAAPAGVILPLAGAPPAGAPIRVRTAGGREAIVLEKMQRGWFRVELDQNANDEGGAGERKSMRRPHGFAPGQDHLLDAAPQAAFVPKPKGSGSSKGRKSSVQQSGPGPVPVGAVGHHGGRPRRHDPGEEAARLVRGRVGRQRERRGRRLRAQVHAAAHVRAGPGLSFRFRARV